MKKKWGVFTKIFEKFEFRKKKIPPKMRQNLRKNDFCPIFCNKLHFFMSNLNSECSQLSFDIHIAHIGQKLVKVRFLPMIFSRSDKATSAPPYGQSMKHRIGFKVSTGR